MPGMCVTSPLILRRMVTAMLVWLTFVSLPVAALAQRIALVVGNSRYEHIGSLATPAEDTRAVAEALRRLGFEVTLLSDVSTEMFNVVLDTFAKESKGAEVVLFYYAGHAYQDNGVNRLVPVAAKLDRADTLAQETWSMDDIAAKISGAGTTLIFLDACRTNPVPEAVRGSGAAAQGLAELDAPAGTFVAFSTRPGAVSYDQGDGVHSPFAQSLLDNLEKPAMSISDLMIRVRNEVEVATVGRQIPWDQSSLREQFYFAGQAQAPLADVPTEDDALAALMLDTVEVTTVFSAVDDGTVAVAEATPAATLEATPEATPEVTPEVTPDPVAVLPEPTQPPASAKAPEVSRLAAAATVVPTIQAISGGRAATVGGVTSATRSTETARLAPVLTASALPPVTGTTITGQDPSGIAVPGYAPVPRPELLSGALQEELKRVGCYRQSVDGDWGQGSRNAARRYFDAKKEQVSDAALDPTEVLWRKLHAETGQVCAPPLPEPAAVKKPQKPRPAVKPAASAKPAKQVPKKPPAPAAPPAKKGVKCTFVVIAIICK